MLVRWYQVGVWNPFFRAHGHIDTKRREPYLLAEPYKSIVRDLLRLRYTMLPVWYTAFHDASVNGMPVLRYVVQYPSLLRSLTRAGRPHYVEFPQDEAGFTLDEQYFIGGSGLLVKPVTTKGATEATVYLPEDQVRILDHAPHEGSFYSRCTTTTSTITLTGAPPKARTSSCPPSCIRPRCSSEAALSSPRARGRGGHPRS